jgi:hypothetical protein
MTTHLYRLIFGAVFGALANAAAGYSGGPLSSWNNAGVVIFGGLVGLALGPWLALLLSDEKTVTDWLQNERDRVRVPGET